MLDLDKLEKKVDDTLANETTESLISWLVQEKTKELSERLGEGDIELLNIEAIEFINSMTVKLLHPLGQSRLSLTVGENRQPYLAMNWCIALDGIYPSRQ